MEDTRKIPPTEEVRRMRQDATREENWKRWGPYLSERQWSTVREDYSVDGNAWDYFPHEHARSRAYRWGEDGLLGWCDRQCRMCFGLALWNGRDPILKERIFGLTGPQGNHGEDVKECYYYLDATPSYSYAKALYKYPQAEFPYQKLIDENARRGKNDREYELVDTGVFDENRYWDVFAEYAKESSNNIAIRITVANRGPEEATLHVLPTLWYRNRWTWGCSHEGTLHRPMATPAGDGLIRAPEESLGTLFYAYEKGPDGAWPRVLFTENETNNARVFKISNVKPYVKDAFHDFVIHGNEEAVNPNQSGTKMAPHFVLTVPAGEERVIRLRLFHDQERVAENFGAAFEELFAKRKREADEFYETVIYHTAAAEAHNVMRQGFAGLLWSKQFYHFVVRDWLVGDPYTPPPPPERAKGRDHEWLHLYSRDVISMPDKWEYPWFAAWDLAFHMIPMVRVDPNFAKQQLSLFMREWYMHPNGQIPAYEWNFSDVNPPVHAWAAWRVYKMSAARGLRDIAFLESIFQKLLINFTWWVNRKDVEGNNLFSGGFLGLDNIGVFDRSKPLPTGGFLQQADGTAWMGFYCLTMLAIAMELSQNDPVYQDMASKFFEHFVAITDALNNVGGTGLWDEADGFYYDRLSADGKEIPLRVRSLVGLMPLIAVEVLEDEQIDRLPGFKKRMEWFLRHRSGLCDQSTFCETSQHNNGRRLLALPSRERLARCLRYMLDEEEFLSPFGLRSVSRVHEKEPYVFHLKGEEYKVDYEPGESSTYLFGGNSNWRGPIWFPINFLLIEALERYHHFYGDTFKIEYPTGSGKYLDLRDVAGRLARRLSGIFLPDQDGQRPCHGGQERYASDPHWKDLVLFHEYFHADNGRGCGAEHQTGWTALIIRYMEMVREAGEDAPQGEEDPGAKPGTA